MAKLRMLGVQTGALEEAAKAVIALKSVGVEEAAAQKAVANAAQGNFAMLQRYIPALKNATSETEKATLVNDFFAKGYDQQAQQLDTVSGQWGLLKTRIGDVWEEIGAAIMQNDALRDALKRASEAVKDFASNIAAWVEGGGVVRLIAGFKIFYADVSHTFKLVGNSANIAWAAIGDGADTVATYMIEKFRYAGDYIAAIWKKVKNPFSAFEAPKAAAGEGIITKRTEAALARREKINEEYAERIEEIAKEQADAQIKHEDRVYEAKKASAEAEKKLAEKVTDVVEKESKKQAQARTAGLKQELSELNRKKQLWEELAKSRVQAVIDEARAAKEVAKEKAKEDARAAELIGREERGTKLGKKDQEFLDAWKKIDAAKSIRARLADAGKSVEGQIKMAEDTLKCQEDIRDSLSNIEDTLEGNLEYSGK